MFIIKSCSDNSYYEGPDTIGPYHAESYSFQIEDAKVFATMGEAEEVCKKLIDPNTVVIPLTN